MALQWYIGIDWDLNGVFTNEGSRVLSVDVRRGVENQLNRDGSGSEAVRPGEFSLRLDNYDGRYDPYNSSSPLYGYILPGRPIQIKAIDGATYDVLYGEIRDIRPVSGTDEVVITGSDALEFLRSQRTSVGTLKSNQSLAQCILDILSGAGWTGSTAIDDNGDSIPYFWTDSGDLVLDAINELVSSVWGKFFVSADGVPTYYSRDRGGSPVLTFDQSYVHREIQVQQPWDSVYNVIEVSARPRRTIALTDIWRLNETPLLESGETRTFWAHYQYNGESCPASSVTTPVANTDYTANSAADGSGTDRTANITIVVTKYSSLTVLAVTNTYSAPVYLTLLKLRGTPLSAQDVVSTQVEDAASIAIFKRRGFKLADNRWIQGSQHANDYAHYLSLFLSSVKRSPWVKLVDRPSYQFAVDLYDPVMFSSARLNLPSDEYLVGSIAHTWKAGQGCLTTLRLEPAISQFAQFWIFTAQLGTTTYFGW